MERIICVDDDPMCLLLGEVVLKQSGYAKDVLLAESGLAALSLLERLYPAIGQQPGSAALPTLILLDLNMPEMSGWDFLDIFKRQYQHLSGLVRIVILSSSIDTADIIRSRQYNAVSDFISKPLTIEVVNKLEKAVAA